MIGSWARYLGLGTQAEADDKQSWNTGYWQLGEVPRLTQAEADDEQSWDPEAIPIQQVRTPLSCASFVWGINLHDFRRFQMPRLGLDAFKFIPSSLSSLAIFLFSTLKQNSTTFQTESSKAEKSLENLTNSEQITQKS